MTYRVIQWATGTVGIHAVPAIVAHPELELAGLWVHSDSKAGQDAGELCGGPAVGVIATQDVDALLALDADCVCYTANSDVRPDGVVEDICRMLASRQERREHVVRAAAVPEGGRARACYDQLQAACLEGGTSFYTSGIDPGFGNAGLAIHTLALCKEVRRVRMMEIVNYDTWDNPFTMFEIMGFGKPDPSAVAAAVARLDHAGVGPGARARGRGDRPHARLRRGAPRDPARRRGHHRSRRAPWRRGRSRGCGSRSSASSTARSASWWSTSPACATTTRPTGRRGRATGSSSRASRT